MAVRLEAMSVSIDKLKLAALEQSQVLRVAGMKLTLGGLVSAAVILLIAFAASWLVTRALRRVRERAERSRQALYLLERLASYAIIVIGVMSALSAAGVNLSSLAVFAGALGIGVGLGLQGVVKEFVSGLFLIFDRMVSVGDYIELEDIGIRGAIMEIGPRATRVRTNDNVNVLVPNSRFIEQPVTNWTLRGDTRRIHVPFTVAYGSDRGSVRDAVLKARGEAYHRAPDSQQSEAEMAETRRLNDRIVAANDAADKADAAAQLDYDAALARYQTEVRRNEEQAHAAAQATRAAQEQYDRDYAAWREQVRLCESGVRSACAAPTPGPR